MGHKFVLVVVFLFLVFSPLVSSQELWEFTNFQNRYAVYGWAYCNVDAKLSCPSEMGWQGNQIMFAFTPPQINDLPESLRFNIWSTWFINKKPVDIYVNNVKIASDYVVDGTGIHTFKFAKTALSPYYNTIRVIMKNAPVGYGQASAGFVFGKVSLESIDPVPKGCLSNTECGEDGFSGGRVCSGGLNISRNYTTYVCVNPGAKGHCSSSVSMKLVKICQGDTPLIGPNYCVGKDVYHSITEYNPGCFDGTCTLKEVSKEEKVKTCSSSCLNGACSSSMYSVENQEVGNNLERRFYYDGFHFITIIESDGAVTIRPHPGTDVNGWGSSLYLQPFFPGAVLRKSQVSNVRVGANWITVTFSGKVSKGTSETYGDWSSKIAFRFNNSTRKISGVGTYTISLSGPLGESTGDLNLFKIASNSLTDVPLLSGGIGDTGDMKEAKVVGSKTFVWVPKDNPSYFPYEFSDSLSIDVKGNYNNVDTAAQGYEPIAAAYKPRLKVVLNSENPGVSMIFGAIYDESQSKNFWSDNVGITPLILKSSTDQNFKFGVQFVSLP